MTHLPTTRLAQFHVILKVYFILQMCLSHLIIQSCYCYTHPSNARSSKLTKPPTDLTLYIGRAHPPGVKYCSTTKRRKLPANLQQTPTKREQQDQQPSHVLGDLQQYILHTIQQQATQSQVSPLTSSSPRSHTPKCCPMPTDHKPPRDTLSPDQRLAYQTHTAEWSTTSRSVNIRRRTTTKNRRVPCSTSDEEQQQEIEPKMERRPPITDWSTDRRPPRATPDEEQQQMKPEMERLSPVTDWSTNTPSINKRRGAPSINQEDPRSPYGAPNSEPMQEHRLLRMLWSTKPAFINEWRGEKLTTKRKQPRMKNPTGSEKPNAPNAAKPRRKNRMSNKEIQRKHKRRGCINKIVKHR